MKQLKWQAWEYRVLAEGHDDNKTAGLIHRTEREVRRKRDELHGSSEAWYSRNRIPAAPQELWRVIRLAYKVWNRDFSDRVAEEKFECQVFNTLTFCFEKFDAAKGDQAVPVEKRFCIHFAYWFARKLRDGLRDDKYDRRKSILRYSEWKATLRHHDEEDPYKEWSRMVKECAIMRLDREAREFIRLHRIEQLTLAEISREFAVSESTLKRRYGSDRDVELIKKEIADMFLKIPKPYLEQLVWTLFYENNFSRERICRLFNVPQPVIDNLIEDVTDKVYERMELTGVKSILLQKKN